MTMPPDIACAALPEPSGPGKHGAKMQGDLRIPARVSPPFDCFFFFLVRESGCSSMCGWLCVLLCVLLCAVDGDVKHEKTARGRIHRRHHMQHAMHVSTEGSSHSQKKDPHTFHSSSSGERVLKGIYVCG